MADSVGFDYWWRWQVPVCALIIAIPAFIFAVMIKTRLRTGEEGLSYGCLWIPCWRGMKPFWLLIYRALAFLSMASVLYQMVAWAGLFAFFFYTQWTFTLVTVYFAIGTVVSAQGCWLYLNGSTNEVGEKEDNSFNYDHHLSDVHGSKEQAGFWGYLMHTIYQVSAGASILTDMVFWLILVPMLLGKEFKMTPLVAFVHSLNIVFLIIDSLMSNLPFGWFGFTYFAWWSVLYITFQWLLHACGFTRWPYPFLELATPWAPLWYLGLAVFHIPCYGLYMMLMKAMAWAFSTLFPSAYIKDRSLRRTKGE